MVSKTFIQHAKQYCDTNKLRFTPPREFVLKVIVDKNKPLGAYDILNALSSDKKIIKPPTIYRAIDFWCSHGFIHRVESLNAYIACCAQHKHQDVQVLICDECGDVTEAHFSKFATILADLAEEESFTALNWNVEIHGRCQSCTHR